LILLFLSDEMKTMSQKIILVIDDEERIREIVCACIVDLGGWQAITAASGEEGLLKAQNELPDAILLDISMPDLDGYQVYQQLQDNLLTQNLPIILLTAKILAGDRQRFSQMRIAGVITKPFNPITLPNKIVAMLGW
jgi:CheY-like chemotaxis protein